MVENIVMVPKLTVWAIDHPLPFRRWFTFFTYVRTIRGVIFFVFILINFFLLKMFFLFSRCNLLPVNVTFTKFCLVFPVFFSIFLNILFDLKFFDCFNSGSSTIGSVISFKYTDLFFLRLLFLSVHSSFDGSLYWLFSSSVPKLLMFSSWVRGVCSSFFAASFSHSTSLVLFDNRFSHVGFILWIFYLSF